MVTLKAPRGDSYTLRVMHEGKEVGRLIHDNLISEPLFDRVKSEEEIKLLNDIEQPEDNIHLNFVGIHEKFRNQGFFKQAMLAFEIFTVESYYKAITLVAEGGMVQFLESIGYAKVGYLNSIDSYIMKKDLY